MSSIFSSCNITHYSCLYWNSAALFSHSSVLIVWEKSGENRSNWSPVIWFCFCFSVSVWWRWWKCSRWKGSALAPRSSWGSWWARVLSTWSCNRPGSCRTPTCDVKTWRWGDWWRSRRTGGRRSRRCLISTTRTTSVTMSLAW